MNPNDEELENFLKKVTEIESIVKGLNSNDPKQVNENLSKANELIKKSDDLDEEDGIAVKNVYNKSMINKYDETENRSKFEAKPNMSQDAFLAMMEQDANERYKRRLENQKVSNELKEKGNEQFKLGNFEKALEFYNESIQKIKDNHLLYTNRAQVLIKLGKYKEAIVDCDWALRCNEKCVKALIHKGRALTFLKEFDSAYEQFQLAISFDQKQTELINEYISEMERCRRVNNQEKAAELFLSTQTNTKNDFDLVKILNEKLTKTDQNILYYSGGIRAICSLCNKEANNKTLFRIQNGFNIFKQHPVISKYFNNVNNSFEHLNSTELDLLISCFELFQVLCVDCDENITFLFKIEEFNEIFIQLLTSLNSRREDKSSKNDYKIYGLNLKLQMFNLMFSITQNEFGINMILKNFDIKILIECFVESLCQHELNSNKNESDLVRTKCLQIIDRFALSTKFQAKLNQSDVQLLLKSLCEFLNNNNVNGTTMVDGVSIIQKMLIFNIIFALTHDARHRKLIILSDIVWHVIIKQLELLRNHQNEHTKDFLNLIISFLINLSSEKSNLLDANSTKLFEELIQFSISENNEIFFKLTGNLIQNNNSNSQQNILKIINERNYVKLLIENIKNEKCCCLDQSVRVLAICSRNSNDCRKQIIALDKSVQFLYKLFENVSKNSNTTKIYSTFDVVVDNVNLKKKFNEKLINNIVLCLTDCVEFESSLAAKLKSSNIIMDLLYLARDVHNESVQKNCGILIAKLCQKEKSHLIRLRELHGVEILHQFIKGSEL